MAITPSRATLCRDVAVACQPPIEDQIKVTTEIAKGYLPVVSSTEVFHVEVANLSSRSRRHPFCPGLPAIAPRCVSQRGARRM
jgi:hypothetical protein